MEPGRRRTIGGSANKLIGPEYLVIGGLHSSMLGRL
jgi:hypothetical protein